MATSERRALSLLPNLNDVTAGAVVLFTYTVRFITLGDASLSAPWWLSLTTDALLPLFAAAWLFVYSMYLLRGR